MRNKYNITQKDYNDLFSGKVKYIISYYERVNYGSPSIESTAPWWKKLLWKYCRHFCLFRNIFHYMNSFQYFQIIVNTNSTSGNNALLWSSKDMKNFIKEKKLKPGDILWVIYKYLGDFGKGYYTRSASQYVILEDGYAKIGRIMGA